MTNSRIPTEVPTSRRDPYRLVGTTLAEKKMSHHSLLQVVARAARANKDVKAGLLVDYLGLTGML